MNKEKIKEALEILKDADVLNPERCTQAIDEAVRMVQAELDKAPKVLTNEFVKARAMEIYPPDEVNDGEPWYGHRRAIEDNAARHMVRHLHKMGYIVPAAGLTVEEAEECLVEHLAQYGADWSAPARSRIRARLTAAIEAKSANP